MAKFVKIFINNYYLGEALALRWMRNFTSPGLYPELASVTHASENIRHDRPNVDNAAVNPLQDGILWTAPRDRRSREKRRTKKFGSEDGHKKMLPVLRLFTCDNCGHAHEPGRLCPHCYGENKEVTTAMQEAMNATQGLNPIEHEVLPVFKGERPNTNSEFYEGKRIVEVPKSRPQWFSRRLTQKSTISTSDSTTVSNNSPLG